MTDLYNSGLRYQPPLAKGGHCLVVFAKGDEVHAVTRGDTVRVLPSEHPTRPTVWRCVHCYLLLPHHALVEGFYPRPCLGNVAALTVGRNA